MQLNKSILAKLIASGMCVLSFQAYAGQSLTIVNNTNQDSTSVINNGLCSTVFGSDGVTKAHSTHVVSDKLISLACALNSSNCKADIYMTNDCSGPIIASAIFDTKTGIKEINVTDSTYAFSNGTFNITIDGGV